MDDEKKTTEEVTQAAVSEETVTPTPAPAQAAPQPVARTAGPAHGNRRGGGFEKRGGMRRGGGSRRPERARPEFDQKILSMRRVTRVVAGGRRFSFSVALVAGDRKGKVGIGTGKAGDTALAIDKAFRDAKKQMQTFRLTKHGSLPHDVQAKYASSVVMIMPAPGRGMVAGGAVRSVLEYAGIKDVAAKILSRSKNGLNNARATIKALENMKVRSK